MKNKISKKLISTAAVLSMSLSAGAAYPVVCSAAMPDTEGIVSPMASVITLTKNTLSLGSGGKLTIRGTTDTKPGYTAEVIVELQQKGSKWTTIEDWTATGGDSAGVDVNYYVESGYSYRLKLTHVAYDSDGKIVQALTKYSNNTVEY